jgi:formylglycine-generating enzyme required for sulfatase activity
VFRRSLLLASLALLATSCTAATELRAAGRVFRDCSDCPELVTVVPEAGALPGVSAIAVGRFEVTRKEFALFERDERLPAPICSFAFIEKDPDQDLPDRSNPGLGEDADNQPAICVSRIEAQAFVEWLSSKTGQRYRLPSEMESRYFQRANAATRFPWGDRSADACSFANGLDQTAASQAWATNPRPELLDYLPTKRGVLDCDDGTAYIAPVGSYKPNALGLYDTTGNVWEWTADCIADEKQWPEGSFYPPCFARGGGWHSSPADLSDQGRLEQLSNVHAPDIGFRVIRLISN